MSQTNQIAYIYNPANQTSEEVFNNFVIRKKELNKVIRELESSHLSSSVQHFLIEGQRGTGKTSLLLRINYEIKHNPELQYLLPVQFAEEHYGIFDLCSLWEKTAELLQPYTGFEDILDVFDRVSSHEDYNLACFNILERFLIKNQKRIVLLLDNVNDILDKLSVLEQKRLRDIFHSSTVIQLISASVKTLEHTYKHDMPFFEFFRIIRLKGLDQNDTLRLLTRLSNNSDKLQAMIRQQPSRIEVLRRLTGGIPRTIVLLYQIFLDNNASIFEDLEKTLDRVTPLYKHRMDDLPIQQQAIINTMALNWDGMTSNEITQCLKNRNFNHTTISLQLQQLEKHELIFSKDIDINDKVYLVKERFFNIWYLMRYGKSKNKLQVRWLIRFLEEWCDKHELTRRAKQHINSAKSGKLHIKGYYMAEALAPLIQDIDLQHEMLSETKKALRGSIASIDAEISISDKELFRKSYGNYENNNFLKSIKLLEILVDKGNANAMFNIANIYQSKIKDTEKAIYYYTMAIKKQHIKAMFNLANLYQIEYKDTSAAIHYYSMAAKKGHSNAMFNLANLYRTEYKDIKKSIHYYVMAANKKDNNAMASLALLYKNKDKQKVDSIDNPYIIATILLWNNNYKKSIKKIKEILIKDNRNIDFTGNMIDYFLLLLAKKQFKSAHDIFLEFPQLKQQFKPIYYAIICFKKEEFPKEHLKMGSELEETVNEIFVKVNEKSQYHFS